MRGVVPDFFLMGVTQGLVDAIQDGALKRCVPLVDDPGQYDADAMLQLDYRKVILQWFVAFKILGGRFLDDLAV
ncbi:hypothetical protein K435DRAFT_778046 [Dendrothele bispora CBS 962.96]|uniref:Uncharacterized protein n=1 Tax=Dendrothele bispora (strain CBS 962.96) TaxID=1314807 RepID=A0A4S8M5F6_DENBC|nr:hypothetical protein K435DRAFT_778046 [Dendrothele bispora CBS 962.96]